MNEYIAHEDIEKKFQKLNTIIIGLPGSGKSSLMDSFSIKPNYLSLGEVTRRELIDGGPMADIIRSKFQTSETWLPEFVVGIVAPYILKAKEENQGFVLDGVPRKMSEAVSLAQWLDEHDLRIDLLLSLHISPEKAWERINTDQTRNSSTRLEMIAHYETRMRIYQEEEEALLEKMQKVAKYYLNIDTNNNPHGFAKNLLDEFIASHF